MRNRRINTFRFLRPDEPFLDPSLRDWSRCYEWGYVLSELEPLNMRVLRKVSVHNTSCGPGELHLDFCRRLEDLGHDVTHSDIDLSLATKMPNFIPYDVLEPSDTMYDVVLSVSTVEHLPTAKIPIALKNLEDQAMHRLIITFDYPACDLGIIERFAGRIIERPEVMMDAENSAVQDAGYNPEGINVGILDISYL